MRNPSLLRSLSRTLRVAELVSSLFALGDALDARLKWGVNVDVHRVRVVAQHDLRSATDHHGVAARRDILDDAFDQSPVVVVGTCWMKTTSAGTYSGTIGGW